MTIGMVAACRNGRNDAITTQVGASALIKLFDGTRPATGGTATNLLVTLPCSATFAPASAAGVLTLNAITSANVTGANATCTWGTVTTSGSTRVFDFSVGTSGADLNMSSVSFVTGGNVAISSFTITDGNP